MSAIDPQVGADLGAPVAAAAVPAPGWRQVPGALAQVSAGSIDRVWGVNAGGNIYAFRNGAWVQIPGALASVSVGADGAVWGVNAAGAIYRREGDTWVEVPGALKQISVGSATAVWGVNAAGNIYRWNGEGWTQVPGALAWVSAASDGAVWGVNAAGVVYRRDGETWTQMPGTLAQVSAGSAARVVGVNAAGEVYRWSGSAWTRLSGTLATVSVASDGTLWGANQAGNVYYHVPPAPLVVSDPRLGEEDLEQDETARYLFDVTNTVPGTVLRNVQLHLLFDQAAFAAAGVSVTPAKVNLPAPLAFGETVTVRDVVLSAAPGARLGRYAFYGVQATYQVVPDPSPSAPVVSGSGGWMPFQVVAPGS
ncbi:MAG TPA: tectonin domain-containing protein [Longimicrobium sp.]|nr:tectonin domain-containing protein [Longimicrobium sp.]